MIKVEKSVVINKPVAEVFAFSQDIEKAAEWQGGDHQCDHEMRKQISKIEQTMPYSKSQILGICGIILFLVPAYQ